MCYCSQPMWLWTRRNLKLIFPPMHCSVPRKKHSDDFSLNFLHLQVMVFLWFCLPVWVLFVMWLSQWRFLYSPFLFHVNHYLYVYWKKKTFKKSITNLSSSCFYMFLLYWTFVVYSEVYMLNYGATFFFLLLGVHCHIVPVSLLFIFRYLFAYLWTSFYFCRIPFETCPERQNLQGFFAVKYGFWYYLIFYCLLL